MDIATGLIAFNNHHLQDDVAVHRTATRTTPDNKYGLSKYSGKADIESRKRIVQNGTSASVGDAVLSLDSPRTKAHEYKNAQSGSWDFMKEQAKAASDDDIFILFFCKHRPKSPSQQYLSCTRSQHTGGEGELG